jgi:hypothetical protein
MGLAKVDRPITWQRLKKAVEAVDESRASAGRMTGVNRRYLLGV